jgi:hypothetical protein
VIGQFRSAQPGWRATLVGATPEERAERASKRLAELPLNASADEIVNRPLKVELSYGISKLWPELVGERIALRRNRDVYHDRVWRKAGEVVCPGRNGEVGTPVTHEFTLIPR